MHAHKTKPPRVRAYWVRARTRAHMCTCYMTQTLPNTNLIQSSHSPYSLNCVYGLLLGRLNLMLVDVANDASSAHTHTHTHSYECPIWRRPVPACHRRGPVPWLLLSEMCVCWAAAADSTITQTQRRAHTLALIWGVFVVVVVFAVRCVWQHLYEQTELDYWTTYPHNIHTRSHTRSHPNSHHSEYNFRLAAQITESGSATHSRTHTHTLCQPEYNIGCECCDFAHSHSTQMNYD